jgi:hypothetical protein
MWDAEPLCAATVLAGLAGAPALEIGTYVGGATVALGRGMQAGAASSHTSPWLICMEKGREPPYTLTPTVIRHSGRLA